MRFIPTLKTQFPIFAALAAALTLASCAEKKDRVDWRERLVRQEAQRQSSRMPELAPADEAATLGEMLLTPTQIRHADAMFDRALSLDPSNAKANFYSAILKPLLTLKGVTKRFGPILSDEHRQRFAQTEQDLATLHPSFAEIVKHLSELAESERSSTLSGGQTFVRTKMLPIFVASIEKLKHVERAGAIEIRFNPEAWTTDASPSQPVCVPSGQSENPWTCSFRAFSQVAVQKLDRESLQRIRSTLTLLTDHIRLTTAYALTEYESFKATFEFRQSGLERNGFHFSPSGATQIFHQFTSFLQLTSHEEFARIATAEESSAHRREFAALKANLCGERAPSNLLLQSVCRTITTLFPAEETSLMLEGPRQVILGYTRAGAPIRARMDLAAYLRAPTTDLKSLFPRRFDSRGEPLSSGDLSLGGLFPDRDYLSRLKTVKTLPMPGLPGALPLQF